MKSQRKWLAAIILLVLLGFLVFCCTLFIKPPAADFDPDSPQALRPLLAYEDRNMTRNGYNFYNTSTIPHPYVRLTPKGYEFLENFTPGCDIVMVNDPSNYTRRR